MDINTKVNSSAWNLEKMEMQEHILRHQIPMGWPNYAIQIPSPPSSSSSIQPSSDFLNDILGIQLEEEEEELGAMKEMLYKMAAMQPVDIDPANIRKPKRRNVRISDDPQSVAARHRRERISEKIRILQRLVPGGTKMDTASMLDEAIRYVKFLKRQIRLLQSAHSQHQQCIHTVATATDCPFAPNLLNSMDMPAPLQFSAGGHASGAFNHEVISD